MQLQTDYLFEKVLNYCVGGVTILLFTGILLAAIFNVPPTTYINDWQLSILGDSYYPFLTAVTLFLPLFIPIVLIKCLCILIFNTFFVKNGEPKIPYTYKMRW